ncbi:MAG: hypothetical protein DMF67_01810 [Acidobacteria bacterium]|nr:MAG: hypothetical protein DMF67_01810 [Acidobacteriota bacterium]
MRGVTFPVWTGPDCGQLMAQQRRAACMSGASAGILAFWQQSIPSMPLIPHSRSCEPMGEPAKRLPAKTRIRTMDVRAFSIAD